MLQISARQLSLVLDFPSLIEKLGQAFSFPDNFPSRQHLTIPREGTPATLLLMPAWQRKGPIGIKIATVFPDNASLNLPSVMATYLLLDGESGLPLALIDGNVLTRYRTAATSALAATYLARAESDRYLMVGAGSLAPYFIRAFRSTFPLKRITIWNRTPDRALRLINALKEEHLEVHLERDLAKAVAEADIISVATLSKTPILQGIDLQQGTHVDLVGGYTPEMREADDEVLLRGDLYVDTRDGALKEAGDILQPLQQGLIRREDIRGDLHDLTSERCSGRTKDHQITVFKSVGHALEDLAAGRLAYERTLAKSDDSISK